MPDVEPHQAYLIVASAEDGTAARPARDLIARLVRRLSPKGAFSITVNRQQGFAIMCGFELEADADKMAATTGAKRIGKYGGWKKQQGFLLDERKRRAILKMVTATAE